MTAPRRWTAAEVATLKERWKAQTDPDLIAAELNRTRASVVSKASYERLGRPGQKRVGWPDSWHWMVFCGGKWVSFGPDAASTHEEAAKLAGFSFFSMGLFRVHGGVRSWIDVRVDKGGQTGPVLRVWLEGRPTFSVSPVATEGVAP